MKEDEELAGLLTLLEHSLARADPPAAGSGEDLVEFDRLHGLEQREGLNQRTINRRHGNPPGLPFIQPQGGPVNGR